MLYITPVNSPGSAWITSLTSVYQGNRLAVFTGTNRGLLRLAGNSLLQGEIRNGYLVDHTMPITLTDGQSWIWSDNEGNNIVSLSRFFSQYHYQLISHGRRYEVAISPLEDHDSLQDTHVDFGSDSICLRRIFKRSGRMYVIYDIFDHYGQSVTATIQDLTKLPSINLRQSCFEKGQIYWPTDQGILKEDVATLTQTLVPHTKKLVQSSDSLVHLGSGKYFLVVRDTEIHYLNI